MKKIINYLDQNFCIEVTLNEEVITLEGEKVYNVTVYDTGFTDYKKEYEIEGTKKLKEDLLIIEDITKMHIRKIIHVDKMEHVMILEELGYECDSDNE